MMKKLILIILSVVAVNAAFAQRHSSDDAQPTSFLGVGFELGLPSNSPLGVGYGGSVKAEFPISQAVALTANAGYMDYSYKESFLTLTAAPADLHPQFMPLKAGVRYQLGPGFYTEGELGDALKLNDGSGGLFDYSFGVGFYVPLSKISVLDIGFRYEGYSENEYRQTGIKVAYRFGW